MKTRLLLISLALSIMPLTAVEASAPTSPGLKIAPKPAKTVWISHEAGEVLNLVRADVADEVVMAFIKNSRTGFSLSADEIIHLHSEGVPDEMIHEMLARKKQAPRPVIVSAPQPAPVPYPVQTIVQQPPTVTYVQPQTVYVPAPTTYVYPSPVYTYYSPYRSHGYHWGSYSYPRVSFNFGFGHGFHHHHHRFGHHRFGHHRSSHFHGGFHRRWR